MYLMLGLWKERRLNRAQPKSLSAANAEPRLKQKMISGLGGGGGSETKISRNFGPRLNGSVQSNQKSFEKTGPLFEVDHFSPVGLVGI